MSDDPSPIRASVPREMSGRRLDEVLETLVTSRSRSQLQKLVRRGRVKLDGRKVVRSNVRVRGGQAVLVHLLDPNAAPEEPEARLVFEDETILVVDKPPGIVTHATERIMSGTLADQLERRFGPLPEIFGTERPGIVHRLDRETSGLVVVGRTPRAMELLKAQFKARSVEKTYLALVHGSPEADRQVIDAPVGPQSEGADRQHVDRVRGKTARTEVRVEERFEGFALVLCRPRTGRRHQLRVHLTSVGCPVVGDALYRPEEPWRPPADAPPVRRHLLHAHTLAFVHPGTGERVELASPCPPDMAAFLAWLRASPDYS